MDNQITKDQALSLLKKIGSGTATPEEKVKILKELNLSMEEVNRLLEDLIVEMKKDQK